MWSAAGDRFRVLRRRKGLTQAELAELSGVSRRMIQRIETGLWGGLTHEPVRRVGEALGAQVRVVVSWNGDVLDRLVDAGHAELQNALAAMLAAAGWLVAVEVSFNHYGDRGRYDILAFHSESRVLVVVEVKTGIGDVQATLGTLDLKVRLAPMIARQRGWPAPLAVIPVLVVADERQQQRIVSQHAALFARFELRGRSARAWLRRPHAGPGGLLVYLPLTDARVVSVRKANRGQRVRRGAGQATKAPPANQMSG